MPDSPGVTPASEVVSRDAVAHLMAVLADLIQAQGYAIGTKVVDVLTVASCGACGESTVGGAGIVSSGRADWSTNSQAGMVAAQLVHQILDWLVR
jgi:hypothetical protein